MSSDTVVIFRRRRNVELAMVLLACCFGLGGWLLTGLNISGTVAPEWPWIVGVWTGMALVAHGLIRWRAPYADPLILPCVIALNGLGLAMIHRIDLIPDPPRHYATTQFLWTALGMLMLALVLVFLRDVTRLERFPYLFFIAGIMLLLLPMVPGLGVQQFGARIWIHLGPYSFQPSEVAKILLAIAFAAYFIDRREVLALSGHRIGPLQLPRARDLGPIAVMWAASMLVLVVQNDFGTALLFFGLFVMMLYVATERPGWVVLGTLAFAIGGWLAGQFAGHIQVRLNAWLHPFDNLVQSGQIIQAQYGFAWGGLTGRGWGLGRPGLTPLSRSDFISAAVGEELGMLGLMAVVLIYALIIARGLRAALTSRDEYTKLLACGLSFVFALQVFAIIGGVTRLLPLTGLTTPFMSQGGSSLISNWAIAGLLIVISHEARRPVAAPLVQPVEDDRPTGELPVMSLEDEPTSFIRREAMR